MKTTKSPVSQNPESRMDSTCVPTRGMRGVVGVALLCGLLGLGAVACGDDGGATVTSTTETTLAAGDLGVAADGASTTTTVAMTTTAKAPSTTKTEPAPTGAAGLFGVWGMKKTGNTMVLCFYYDGHMSLGTVSDDPECPGDAVHGTYRADNKTIWTFPGWEPDEYGLSRSLQYSIKGEVLRVADPWDPDNGVLKWYLRERYPDPETVFPSSLDPDLLGKWSASDGAWDEVKDLVVTSFEFFADGRVVVTFLDWREHTYLPETYTYRTRTGNRTLIFTSPEGVDRPGCEYDVYDDRLYLPGFADAFGYLCDSAFGYYHE